MRSLTFDFSDDLESNTLYQKTLESFLYDPYDKAYEEIEALCQWAIRIEKGKLVDVVDIPSLNDPEEKVFQAGFAKPETIVFPAFVSLRSYEKEKGLYTLAIDKKDIAAFVRWLSSTPVLFLYEKRFGLRDYFSRKEKSV